MSHPYQNLPDRNFWRRSVSTVESCHIDPVAKTRFQLTDQDVVATAGSCFAQHIARVLSQSGYRYLVSEKAPASLSEQDASAKSYGIFTARYGNIYTARQLLQLLQEAYGLRKPAELVWQRKDGQYVDALRPTLDPDGFASADDVLQEREVLMAAVRDMVSKMDVFMFTLGLTESWLSLIDGTVYPVAPGANAGEFNETRHAFHNFSAREVTQDMAAALKLLKSKNPDLKSVITVSPVPLIATYEPRHVLTSTIYSKSVLRVVAQEMYETFDWVDYFPSYEVITSTGNVDAYYENDRREVSSIGVARAMYLFKKHYLEGGSIEPKGLQINDQAQRNRDLICDEELLDIVERLDPQ